LDASSACIGKGPSTGGLGWPKDWCEDWLPPYDCPFAGGAERPSPLRWLSGGLGLPTTWGPGNRYPLGSAEGRIPPGNPCPSNMSESDGRCLWMFSGSRFWSSTWPPEWRGPGNGGWLESGLKVGERSAECRSTSLKAGERIASSGGEAMAGADGGNEGVYCESLVETMEPTLCLLVGGSLPLRLSAPLPLLLVLVGVAPGLPRPDSESLSLLEASLSAVSGGLLRPVHGKSGLDIRLYTPCNGEACLALKSWR
jgi:hypothetical protein